MTAAEKKKADADKKAADKKAAADKAAAEKAPTRPLRTRRPLPTRRLPTRRPPRTRLLPTRRPPPTRLPPTRWPPTRWPLTRRPPPTAMAAAADTRVAPTPLRRRQWRRLPHPRSKRNDVSRQLAPASCTSYKEGRASSLPFCRMRVRCAAELCGLVLEGSLRVRARPSRPVTTVATIVDRDGASCWSRRKRAPGCGSTSRPVISRPARRCVAAAIRETLEETGWHVTPTALVGIYRWQAPDTGATFIRFAFAADVVAHDAAPHARRRHPARALADLRRDRRAPRRSTAARSSCAASTIIAPGVRWPLDFVTEL